MDASMYKTKYKSWLKRASCRVVRPISKILVASVLLTSVPVLGGSTATGVDGRVKEQSGYREVGQDEGEQRYKNYYVSYFKRVVPLGSESLKKKVSITNQDIQAWKKKKGYKGPLTVDRWIEYLEDKGVRLTEEQKQGLTAFYNNELDEDWAKSYKKYKNRSLAVLKLIQNNGLDNALAYFESAGRKVSEERSKLGGITPQPVGSMVFNIDETVDSLFPQLDEDERGRIIGQVRLLDGMLLDAGMSPKQRALVEADYLALLTFLPYKDLKSVASEKFEEEKGYIGLFQQLTELEKYHHGDAVLLMSELLNTATPLGTEEGGLNNWYTYRDNGMILIDTEYLKNRRMDEYDNARTEPDENKWVISPWVLNVTEIINPGVRREFLFNTIPFLIADAHGSLEEIRLTLYGSSYEYTSISNYEDVVDLSTVAISSESTDYRDGETVYQHFLNQISGFDWATKYQGVFGKHKFVEVVSTVLTDVADRMAQGESFDDALDNSLSSFVRKGEMTENEKSVFYNLIDSMVDNCDFSDAENETTKMAENVNYLIGQWGSALQISEEFLRQYTKVYGLVGMDDLFILASGGLTPESVKMMKTFYGLSAPLLFSIDPRPPLETLCDAYDITYQLANKNVKEVQEFIQQLKNKQLVYFGSENVRSTSDGYLVLDLKRRYVYMITAVPSVSYPSQRVTQVQSPADYKLTEGGVQRLPVYIKYPQEQEIAQPHYYHTITVDEEGNLLIDGQPATVVPEEVPVPDNESIYSKNATVIVFFPKVEKEDGGYVLRFDEAEAVELNYNNTARKAKEKQLHIQPTLSANETSTSLLKVGITEVKEEGEVTSRTLDIEGSGNLGFVADYGPGWYKGNIEWRGRSVTTEEEQTTLRNAYAGADLFARNPEWSLMRGWLKTHLYQTSVTQDTTTTVHNTFYSWFDWLNMSAQEYSIYYGYDRWRRRLDLQYNPFYGRGLLFGTVHQAGMGLLRYYPESYGGMRFERFALDTQLPLYKMWYEAPGLRLWSGRWVSQYPSDNRVPAHSFVQVAGSTDNLSVYGAYGEDYTKGIKEGYPAGDKEGLSTQWGAGFNYTVDDKGVRVEAAGFDGLYGGGGDVRWENGRMRYYMFTNDGVDRWLTGGSLRMDRALYLAGYLHKTEGYQAIKVYAGAGRMAGEVYRSVTGPSERNRAAVTFMVDRDNGMVVGAYYEDYVTSTTAEKRGYVNLSWLRTMRLSKGLYVDAGGLGLGMADRYGEKLPFILAQLNVHHPFFINRAVTQFRYSPTYQGIALWFDTVPHWSQAGIAFERWGMYNELDMWRLSLGWYNLGLYYPSLMISHTYNVGTSRETEVQAASTLHHDEKVNVWAFVEDRYTTYINEDNNRNWFLVGVGAGGTLNIFGLRGNFYVRGGLYNQRIHIGGTTEKKTGVQCSFSIDLGGTTPTSPVSPIESSGE